MKLNTMITYYTNFIVIHNSDIDKKYVTDIVAVKYLKTCLSKYNEMEYIFEVIGPSSRKNNTFSIYENIQWDMETIIFPSVGKLCKYFYDYAEENSLKIDEEVLIFFNESQENNPEEWI